MESVGKECQELKVIYDECFNKWFAEKFLKGSKKDECASLFAAYQVCVKKAIKDKGIDVWEMEEPILGTDKEKKPKT